MSNQMQTQRQPAVNELALAAPADLAVSDVRDNGPTVIDIERLIDRGLDAKASVEVMQELLAMRRTLQEEQAEKAFDKAMTAFQSECPVIQKTRKGGVAKYAAIEDIEPKIRDIRIKHGFSHTFDMDTASEKGVVIMFCIVKHVGGHKRPARVKMPMPEKTRAMNDAQQCIAAQTYAKRAALVNAYGIVIAGEDTDGGAPPKQPGPAKATEKTRQHMIQKLGDIEQKAQAAFIDWGWIEPDQWLEHWPLEFVPTSKEELAELRKRIEEHN